MKVILTADIKNIGLKSDEKEVKSGFARNFLFPRKLAVSADSLEGLKQLLAKKSETEKHQEEAKKIVEVAKQNLGITLTFERKASKGGRLFGSVSTGEIKSRAEEKLGTLVQSVKPNVAVKTTGAHKFTLILKENQKLDARVNILALNEGKR